MNNSAETRVTELEIRLTHMEDTIESLNQTIIKQYAAIDALQLQITVLEKKLKTVQETNIAHESEETPPPHY